MQAPSYDQAFELPCINKRLLPSFPAAHWQIVPKLLTKITHKMLMVVFSFNPKSTPSVGYVYYIAKIAILHIRGRLE